MIFLFPKKAPATNIHLFKKPPPSIEDLCSGRVGNVAAILKNNKEKRKDYSISSGGYTKKKVSRHLLDIPMEVLFHPEMGKYFAKGMDPHERKKNRYAFLRKYPMFQTAPKL